MKIKLAIIFNLLILLNASTISITICKCEQLLSQTDCQHQNNDCLWISDKCVINPSQSDSGAQTITYCTSYKESECASVVGCAWINKACEQFLECQQISLQCQSDGSHCIEISDCADYKTKSACSRNKKNVLCYWNEDKCEDYTECSQLPKSLLSDSECRAQLQKCTVGEQSGCVESAENCEDQKLVSQCKWNKLQTQQCIWQSDKCVSLSCSIAPVTYTTHSQCYEFMVGCTTQQNGGCTNITSCSNAKVEAACVINNLNEPCVWSDNSCYDQVCNKAPTTFKTNEQCKTIANNCITTLNGCVEQLSCSSSNNQTGCIDMADGTKCYWNGSQCVIKGCSSNTTATSEAECETYSSECTFNVSASIGCVDKICENIIKQDQCTVDAFNNNCIWKSNCFVKQCVFAPKTYQTQAECETYLMECGLDESGFGCMNKLLSCSAYVTEKSCNKTKSGGGCAWNNQKCVERQCNMADNSITTTGACQLYKSDCVVNNNQNGCMNLTTNCGDRHLKENCEFGTSPFCVWNNIQCVQQSCETASVVGSRNYLTYFTQSNCNQYMNNCVLNNSSNGCMTKPTTCNQLGISNCYVSIQNDCIWTGGQCLEKVCSNLIGSTHQDCYSQYNKCTVNSSLNGCMNLQKCQYYPNAQQCQINSAGVLCVWTGIFCRESICSDSTDSNNFDSHDKCKLLNPQCTVVSRVDQKGCVSKLNNCVDYKYRYQCYSTINQVDCIWAQSRCQELQSLDCSVIPLQIYNDANCSAVLFRCKSNYQNNQCTDKVCTDYLYTTKGDCEKISGCTLNRDANGCNLKKDFCYEYTADLWQCKYSKEGECAVRGIECVQTHVDCNTLPTPTINTDCSNKRDFCIMIVSGTTQSCSAGQCSSFVGSTYSFEACQAYDYSCTVNRASTGCASMADTCRSATSDNCVYSKNDHKCIWTGTVCKPVANATEQNCQLLTNPYSNLTFEYCQQYSNNYCSVNRARNACINMKTNCTLYTDLDNCYQSSRGRCIQNKQENKEAACIDIPNSISCDQILLGETFYYTHEVCQQLNGNCTNDSDLGCIEKTCKNIKTYPTTHEECESWLSICTIDVSSNACIEKNQSCSQQNASNCLWTQEGQCIVINNKCMKAECHLLSTNQQTHYQCSNMYNKCTIANQGGCITKLQNCSSYLTEIQCKYNYGNQKCWWNQSTLKCVTLLCDQLAQQYAIADCPSLKPCNQYTAISECVIDNQNQPCVWNTITNRCQYKQCNAASISSYFSHQQCQYFDSKCTVQVKLNNQQEQIAQGCREVSISCSDYKFEQQCFITKDNKKCAWFESACILSTCDTAPKTADYSTHQSCQEYLNTCTVSPDQLGCITIPKQCTDINLEISCIRDGSGNDCFWYDSKCQIKTCSAAPPEQNNALLCSLWLPNCTAEDKNKCKRNSCEEYEYTTDSECKAAMQTCTTDGIKCVQRRSCSASLSEAGCTTSINNEQCYWIGDSCTLKVCQIINKEKDCNVSYNNIKCIWQNGICRNVEDCQDYTGTNHTDCQKQNVSCTIGDNQKCMKLKSCAEFNTSKSCVQGLDGPCRWVPKLSKCFQFTSCKSIQFTTDQECKMVSPLCTTDGLNCIAITLCAETNTDGGCVSGIDGDCIMTVPALNSTLPPICKLFTSCADAYYLTHQDCQNASKKCTTDGLNGCIELSECDQYVNQASCNSNSIGVQLQNDQIISTGACVWNQSGKCANQTCTDLYGTSHQLCTLPLSTCTYDGVTCISKLNCSEYKTQDICSVAYGLEGRCNWNVVQGICSPFTCSSIMNGMTLEYCQSTMSSCITDGFNCINKDVCSSYTTKIACTIGGTDGICVWNGFSCQLMQSCNSADVDQDACLMAKDRCTFKYGMGITTSSCSSHTCESYEKTNGKCSSIYNWDKSFKKSCQLVDGKCVEFDLTILDQSRCYTVSEYTYTWNAQMNKCQSCNVVIDTTTNQTQNQSNQTTNATTDPASTVNDFARSLELIIMFLIMVY
ncbi:unnamed protein product [Paramecium octaurelia]|uniref:PSI domain-containing protein n=1 Tax=Paramecium octaurelia TaxID=43137 RepID=A0A8S1Y0K5_PAROT|nr:unnamed protein product [Paramecium octaurelia]